MKKLLRFAVAGLAALAPWMVQAQLLPFDNVCPVTPCAIGTLYAASGVNFTPNTAQIVAAGTNGLTGQVGGGKYLAVSAFPYQMTITLARQATFFSLQLSRASTSSGPVTVNVTWLKLGVVVGSTNVVLTTVNTWSQATATAPGGFDTIFLDPSGGANLSFGIDGVFLGGTCYGFSDVSPSDIFCNAAEWAANRGVTTGCGPPGQFCPGDAVSRGQMVLFMNRLGNALSPVFLTAAGVNAGSDPGAGTHYCQTNDYLVPFPQVAQAFSTLNFFNPPAVGLYRFQSAFSTDGGANWTTLGPFVSYESPTPGQGASGVHVATPLNIVPGQTIRFSVRVDRFSGSAGGLGEVQCQVQVRINNRGNTTVAPFDVPHVGGNGPSSR